MSEERIFPARSLALWIVVATAAFAAALFFMGRGDKSGTPGGAVGPSAFSRSAIGHAGIAQVLERLGVPVVKSRYNSLEKLGAGSVLVIAEPHPTSGAEETIRKLLKAHAVLLVLPKWTGAPSTDRPGWIAHAGLVSTGQAKWVLQLAVAKGEVVQLAQAAEAWSQNALGPVPTPALPVQLVRSEALRPIVAGSDGILVGEVRDKEGRLWVLSDPDVIANHGIAKGANAAFAVALFDALRGSGGSVVFDEMVHGYAVEDVANPLKLLVEVPFVFGTVQAALAVLLLLWGATTRFGAPEAAPLPLDAGRQGLIRNAASLLEFAGHQQVIVERYVQATLRYVAGQMRAPRGLADEALVDWLQQLGRTRGITVDCAEVARRARALLGARRPDHRALAQTARDIHRWKREIIDGPTPDPRRR